MTTPADLPAPVPPTGPAGRAAVEIVGLLLLLCGAVLVAAVLYLVDPLLMLGALGAALVAVGWRMTTPPTTES